MASSWTVFELAHAQAVVAHLVAKGGPDSANDTLDLRQSLTPIVGDVPACVIAAWVGGAPAEANQEWVDQRKPAEDMCEDNSAWLGLSYKYTVAEALAALAEQDPQLAQAVKMIGTTKEAKEKADFEQNAADDAKEITDKIKQGAAIGGGVSMVALAVAAGIYLWLLKKG